VFDEPDSVVWNRNHKNEPRPTFVDFAGSPIGYNLILRPPSSKMKIIEFMVSFGYENDDIVEIRCEGDSFNPKVLAYLKNLKTWKFVIVSCVKIKNTDGRLYYLKDITIKQTNE
jgi:hypothetical protein